MLRDHRQDANVAVGEIRNPAPWNSSAVREIQTNISRFYGLCYVFISSPHLPHLQYHTSV